MKKVKGNSLNFNLLFLIFINVLLVTYYIKKNEGLPFLIISFVIINLFAWIITYNSFHYFLYDKQKLVIKNSWNVFIEKEYSLEEIKQVKVGYMPFSGKSLLIYFKNGKKKLYGASNCTRKQLESFVVCLNNFIEQ
jgi:hypothetical protein